MSMNRYATRRQKLGQHKQGLHKPGLTMPFSPAHVAFSGLRCCRDLPRGSELLRNRKHYSGYRRLLWNFSGDPPTPAEARCLPLLFVRDSVLPRRTVSALECSDYPSLTASLDHVPSGDWAAKHALLRLSGETNCHQSGDHDTRAECAHAAHVEWPTFGCQRTTRIAAEMASSALTGFSQLS